MNNCPRVPLRLSCIRLSDCRLSQELELKQHSLKLLEERMQGSEVHQLSEAVAGSERELQEAQQALAAAHEKKKEMVVAAKVGPRRAGWPGWPGCWLTTGCTFACVLVHFWCTLNTHFVDCDSRSTVPFSLAAAACPSSFTALLRFQLFTPLHRRACFSLCICVLGCVSHLQELQHEIDNFGKQRDKRIKAATDKIAAAKKAFEASKKALKVKQSAMQVGGAGRV